MVGSFDRHNLFYGVKSCNRSISFINELVKDVSKRSAVGESTIVYCTTIRETEQVCEFSELYSFELANPNAGVCIFFFCFSLKIGVVHYIQMHIKFLQCEFVNICFCLFE